MSDLSFTVASWYDREDLVIELTVGDGAETQDWGLITYDAVAGRPVVDLYPHPTGGDWRFDLDEVVGLLSRAKARIIEVAGPLDPADTPVLEPARELVGSRGGS